MIDGGRRESCGEYKNLLLSGRRCYRDGDSALVRTGVIKEGEWNYDKQYREEHHDGTERG